MPSQCWRATSIQHPAASDGVRHGPPSAQRGLIGRPACGVCYGRLSGSVWQGSGIGLTSKQVLRVGRGHIVHIALHSYGNHNWMLIAWCRLRQDFRTFRIDKIERLDVLSERFEPHKMTIEDYYEKYILPNLNP